MYPRMCERRGDFFTLQGREIGAYTLWFGWTNTIPSGQYRVRGFRRGLRLGGWGREPERRVAVNALRCLDCLLRM